MKTVCKIMVFCLLLFLASEQAPRADCLNDSLFSSQLTAVNTYLDAIIAFKQSLIKECYLMPDGSVNMANYTDPIAMINCVEEKQISLSNKESALEDASKSFAKSQCFEDIRMRNKAQALASIENELRKIAGNFANGIGKNISGMTMDTAEEETKSLAKIEEELDDLADSLQPTSTALSYRSRTLAETVRSAAKLQESGNESPISTIVEEVANLIIYSIALEMIEEASDNGITYEEFMGTHSHIENFLAMILDIFQNVSLYGGIIDEMVRNAKDYYYTKRVSPYMGLLLNDLARIGSTSASGASVGIGLTITYNGLTGTTLYRKGNNCKGWKCPGDRVKEVIPGAANPARISSAYVVYYIVGKTGFYGEPVMGLLRLENKGNGTWTGTIPWHRLKSHFVQTGDKLRYALVMYDEFGIVATEDLFPKLDINMPTIDQQLSSKYALPIVDITCPGTTRDCFPVMDPKHDLSYSEVRGENKNYDLNYSYGFSTRYSDISCEIFRHVLEPCGNDCDDYSAKNTFTCNTTSLTATQNPKYPFANGFDIKGVNLKISGDRISAKIHAFPGYERMNNSSLSPYFGRKSETVGVLIKNDSYSSRAMKGENDDYFPNSRLALYAMPNSTIPGLPGQSDTGSAFHYIDVGCLTSTTKKFYFEFEELYKGEEALLDRLYHCISYFPGSMSRENDIITMTLSDRNSWGTTYPLSIYFGAQSEETTCVDIIAISNGCNTASSFDVTQALNYYGTYHEVTFQPGPPDAPEMLQVECDGNRAPAQVECKPVAGGNKCRMFWQPDVRGSQFSSQIQKYRIYKSVDKDDPFKATKVAEIPGFMYEDAPLLGGRFYYYYISSVDYQGRETTDKTTWTKAVCTTPFVGTDQWTDDTQPCANPQQ